MTEATRTPFDQSRMQLLDEIARVMKSANDSESVLRLGAQCAVPALADLVAIHTPQNGEEWRLHVLDVGGREGEIRELLQPLLPRIRAVAARDAARGRDFRWIPHVNEISLRFLTKEPQLVELLSLLGIRSFMVVPLRSASGVLGAMAFARFGRLPFHAADLNVAQVLARRIAAGLQNAEMHERTLDDQAQRARLEAAVERWVRVFDLAGWGAAIVDGADYRIESVNPAFARLHGYHDSNLLVGRPYADLLPPDRAGELGGWRAERNGPQPYESAHLRRDGTVFPVLTDVTPLTTGTAISFVITIQDLTELKRTEERLRRAQRLEAVGRLAGGVAHEVNNMMTIILGFADLLSRSRSLPAERQRDVEEIRKAATRAGKTTQQLLAFSRQQILQPTDLHLNEVIDELVPTLRLLLPANVDLQTTLSRPDAMVHADRAQLHQVLINLAFNARDAMPGGGTLRLVTGARQLDADTGRRLIGIPIPSGQYATVSVIDTGHGMDAKTVAQVFEPFFTTKPVGRGTGLGLATVYGIVKQSGGYVWVESTPGEGTTITVCLPQVETPANRRDSGSHKEVLSGECRSGTVLLVEDEDGVRDLARRVLELQGHRVLEARDGAEALDVLERFASDLDLVISDVIVPDIGTNELEHGLRRRRPDLPILYMSGYSREEMIERGLVAPAGPFLQKPFTAEELGQMVCRQLESSSARGDKVNT